MFMALRGYLATLLLITSAYYAEGQDTWYGPGFQTMVMRNPAFSGSEGDGILRISYMNFYPGNHYNLHSVYLSYDSYVPVLHGGAGLYISSDYLGGIINDIRSGFSYAYFLKAGNDFYINGGLSASVYRRAFSFRGAVLPDQIDPTGIVAWPSGETLANRGRTVFDIGTGFIFSGPVFTGGFSINHLAEPTLSEKGSPADRVMRRLLIHLSADIGMGGRGTYSLQPLALAEMQDRFFIAGAGASAGNDSFKVNVICLADNNNNIDFQTGFSLRTGRMAIYYNYLFNIVSGNTSMPFSLLHQTGVSFSLNSVEKRYIMKTIKYPDL